ncbi:hypothetical protein pb186bvf_013594 [Paramecium bursaria]
MLTSIQMNLCAFVIDLYVLKFNYFQIYNKQIANINIQNNQMRYFRQTFTNKDLEREYQLEQLELTKKGYFQFQIIFITAMGILLVDQILKQNLAMIIWFILLEISTSTFLCLSYRYQTFLNYVHYHLYFFNLMGSISQILFSQCGFLNLLPFRAYCLQYCLLVFARCNHLGTSLVYLIFVATRVFVQIVNGSSLASIAYVTFNIYFFIDQYKMSKGRRKLFLKSQRNKQLELLIEEFIDDQVSIIEKDEQNVKFKTIILNKRLSEVADQFNIFLRDVTVPQYKSHLQDYLYNSTKQRESILCYYKNQNYQITYQTFTFKKQQMFIKIQLLFQQINKQIDYKELYKSLITKMNFKPQKSYKGLYIIQKLYMNSFYLSFSRYYSYYHISQELISHQYLKHLFIKSKIQWMTQDFIQPFYSDKKLLYILVIKLKKIIKDDIIWIYKEKEFIRIVFFVKQIIYQEQLNQINKILYHIGYGQTEQTILNNQTQVTLILMDKMGLENFL